MHSSRPHLARFAAALFLLLVPPSVAQAPPHGDTGDPGDTVQTGAPPGAEGAETDGETGAAPTPEEARAARLAADRAALEAALARMQAVPWRADWLDAVAAHHDPELRWTKTADGYLARTVLEFELDWNRPRKDRELVRRDDALALPHPIDAIVDLQQQLGAQGIELLVVPVPARLHVYPELVLDGEGGEGGEGAEGAEATDWDAFRGYGEGLVRFLLALNEAGVETLDLLPVLAENRWGEDPERPGERGEQVFLKYNMHWTPRAALAAAEAVQARVAQFEHYVPGRHLEGHQYVVNELHGEWAPSGSRNQPQDTVPEEFRFLQVQTPAGEALRVDAKRATTLLIGDSFATHYSVERASFSEHLYRLMGRPYDRVAIKGGGVLQVRRQLQRRKEGLDVPSKEIVIWLFSVTTLKQDSDWVRVPFFPEDEEPAGGGH